MSKNSLEGEVWRQINVVGAVVHKYWPVLPMSVKAWYEPEDMVHDAIAHLITKQEYFNPDKALATTFIHSCTINFCRGVLIKHQTQKRTMEPVELLEARLASAPCPTTFDYEFLAWLLGVVEDETRKYLAMTLLGEIVTGAEVRSGTRKWERIKDDLLQWDKRTQGAVRQALLVEARAR